MESKGVPYAYSLGNHDRIPGPNGTVGGNESSYYVSDHWIMQFDYEVNDQTCSLDGPSSISGASNYVLPVLGQDDKPAFYVWIFDSSDNTCEGKSGWGCVYPDQVKWYRNMSAKLSAQDGRMVPGFSGRTKGRGGVPPPRCVHICLCVFISPLAGGALGGFLVIPSAFISTKKLPSAALSRNRNGNLNSHVLNQVG